jgi:hypothetical protein
MLALILAAAVAAPPALSPKGQALVSAIQASIDEVRARQAKLPPPKDDAERLVRLGDFDQAPRKVITAWDFSTIPEAERTEATRRASALIEAVDREDQAALLKMLPPEGWFLKSRYGAKAASAAFLIVQHSNHALQARFLPVLEPLVKQGEVEGDDYALMFDRVAVSEGRPQRYGSQFRCDGGKWRPYPIEDPAHLEARRKAMGFVETFADDKAIFAKMPSCPPTRSPPPPGMKLD